MMADKGKSPIPSAPAPIEVPTDVLLGLVGDAVARGIREGIEGLGPTDRFVALSTCAEHNQDGYTYTRVFALDAQGRIYECLERRPDGARGPKGVDQWLIWQELPVARQEAKA